MLSVRAAEPVDAMEVAQVHVRSWQAAYRGLLPDGYLDGLQPEDRAASYTFGLSEPNQPATIVAVEGEAIRGFAATGRAQSEDALGMGELLAIYVDPGHWGRGVGRLLMHDARARLSEQGFVEVILWVLVGNQQAERFYRGDGWLPDGGRREGEVWCVTANEVRYRRNLG